MLLQRCKAKIFQARILPLGSFLLIATLLLGLLKSSMVSGIQALAIMGAFWVCSRWHLRGFIVSALLLNTVFFIQEFAFDVWNVSWACGLFFSLLIFSLASQEDILFYRTQEEQSKAQEQKALHLNQLLLEAQGFAIQEKKEAQQAIESMKASVAETQNKVDAYKNWVSIHEKEIEQLSDTVEKLNQESLVSLRKAQEFERALQEAKMQIAEMEKAKEKRIEALNEVKVDHFQLSILHDEKESQLRHVREELEKLSEELKVAAAKNLGYEVPPSFHEKTKRDTQIEKQYQLLKTQFEEKSEVLHQTRRELFEVENKLLAFQKDWEHQALELPAQDQVLIHHLKEVEEECKDLETQVEYLQDLVTHLLGKKKSSRQKKTKSKSAQDEPLLLSLDETQT